MKLFPRHSSKAGIQEWYRLGVDKQPKPQNQLRSYKFYESSSDTSQRR